MWNGKEQINWIYPLLVNLLQLSMLSCNQQRKRKRTGEWQRERVIERVNVIEHWRIQPISSLRFAAEGLLSNNNSCLVCVNIKQLLTEFWQLSLPRTWSQSYRKDLIGTKRKEKGSELTWSGFLFSSSIVFYWSLSSN